MSGICTREDLIRVCHKVKGFNPWNEHRRTPTHGVSRVASYRICI